MPIFLLARHFPILFFFLSIFITGCHQKTTPFLKKEEKKITQFLEELLLEHGGIYTLFGSKPMTAEILHYFSRQEIELMNDYLQKNPQIEYLLSERCLEEGWEIWKKYHLPISDNFILTEIETKDLKILVFANRTHLFNLLEEFHQEFEAILGNCFSSLELMNKLNDHESQEWSCLLRNPISCGILFGYGKNNALGFEKEWQKEEPSLQRKVSENNDPRIPATYYLDQKPFRLPIFAIFDEKESKLLIEKYSQEREEIAKIYAERDFLKVTMSQLCKKEKT